MKLQIAGHQMENYRINTPVYEGPLALLLELIEKAELDITTLALAQVTDQYLAYLHNLEEQDPAEVSAFLVVAAKLLQIKSISLLPRPPIIQKEEEDLGEQLVQQLILYKKFKQAAVQLENRELSGLRSYVRVSPAAIQIDSRPDLTGITVADLCEAAFQVLIGEAKASLDQVVNLPRITIREKIKTILDILKLKDKITFGKLIRTRSRVEIVVTFLALLELVKRHIIDVKQEQLFQDIEMQSAEAWQDTDDMQLEFEE